jgi:hypothetical protein
MTIQSNFKSIRDLPRPTILRSGCTFRAQGVAVDNGVKVIKLAANRWAVDDATWLRGARLHRDPFQRRLFPMLRCLARLGFLPMADVEAHIADLDALSKRDGAKRDTRDLRELAKKLGYQLLKRKRK